MNKSRAWIWDAVILAVVLVSLGIIYAKQSPSVGDNDAANSVPTFLSASSTVFTLTTTSQRLLASSTPTRRLAATIQPTLCTAATNGLLYLSLNADAPAVAVSGTAAYGSTTLELKDYPNLPVVQGSVQGITSAGTCTVLVTEWRSKY